MAALKCEGCIHFVQQEVSQPVEVAGADVFQRCPRDGQPGPCPRLDIVGVKNYIVEIRQQETYNFNPRTHLSKDENNSI